MMQRIVRDLNDDPFESESSVRFYCRRMPGVFSKAKNALVWSEKGDLYYDLLAGCGALNYGHNHEYIQKRLLDYISQDGITTAMDLHTPAKRTLLKELRDTILLPRDLNYRVQFPGPTGTNAIEAALKLARKVARRRNVVAFTNAFHGMTLGALAATGNRAARNGAGVPLSDVHRLAFEGYHGANTTDLERYEQLVNDPSGGLEPPAAFLFETVQAEGGLNVASGPWLRRLAKIAKRMGALLIVDDIQAGCGRTGGFFSFEDAGIKPDIVCLSKSIGGMGLPLSLVLIKPEYDLWEPGEHNGTFRGHNLAFVAATAALELWRDSHFLASIKQRSDQLDLWIRRVSGGRPGHIRTKGRGLMRGLEFTNSSFARCVATAAFQENVLIETCGPQAEVLKIMPPLTIERDVLDEALVRVERAITKVLPIAASCGSHLPNQRCSPC